MIRQIQLAIMAQAILIHTVAGQLASAFVILPVLLMVRPERKLAGLKPAALGAGQNIRLLEQLALILALIMTIVANHGRLTVLLL